MEENDINAAQFFYNFWYNRNSSAPEKEWKVYADKLNYVSKKYGRNGMPGFETDRGKLYLMFGEPNITEKRDNEQGSLPYEVWFYYETKGRKNVKFLFYQPGSISDQLIILHSSEQDILVNPYWKRVLLQDPTNGDNKLKYRVFEYFN
jgi:GWxTD domain-containing protein